MKKFEFFDHTGDEGVMVFGKSIGELFQNAAESFFEVLTDAKVVQPVHVRKISLAADDYDDLLVSWLNELLYFFDTELFLGSRYEIRKLSRDHLSADVWGERYDEHRHRIRRVIKAVTYHQLSVRECQGRWEARVVFDL